MNVIEEKEIQSDTKNKIEVRVTGTISMDDDLGQFIVAVLKDQAMISRRLAACVCLLAFVVLSLAIVTFKKAN